MFGTKIRTSTAAIVAAAALSTTVTGVASAAVAAHKPGDNATTTVQTTSAHRIVHPGIGGIHPVSPGTGVSARPVEGGATGDGPATDKDCEAIAGEINNILDAAQQVLNEQGNGATYNNLIDGAKNLQDSGMDQGCFFVNPV